MKKQIILPTDFSKSARNASLYAIKLFGVEEVEYTLLNCYAMPHSGADMLISLIDILRAESEEGLEEELKELRKMHPELGEHIKVKSVNGFLENVLSRLNREEKIDLVVMGTTGASGLMKVLWGSTTASVMKRVRMPILAIPGDLPFKLPHEISIALAPSELAEYRYPALLRELIERNNARVSLVSVENEAEARSDKVFKSVANGEIPMPYNAEPFQVIENDPIQGITHFIDDHKTDLLVMVAHSYGFFRELFHQSSTREMAMISKVPLLVFHDR